MRTNIQRMAGVFVLFDQIRWSGSLVYVPESSHSVQHRVADPPLRSAWQQPRNCLKTKCWRMMDAVTPSISLTVLLRLFCPVTLSSLKLLVPLCCGFTVGITAPLNVFKLLCIQDTSGCLSGLVNKPVFIPLVLLACRSPSYSHSASQLPRTFFLSFFVSLVFLI